MHNESWGRAAHRMAETPPSGEETKAGLVGCIVAASLGTGQSMAYRFFHKSSTVRLVPHPPKRYATDGRCFVLWLMHGRL